MSQNTLHSLGFALNTEHSVALKKYTGLDFIYSTLMVGMGYEKVVLAGFSRKTAEKGNGFIKSADLEVVISGSCLVLESGCLCS